MEMTPLVSTAYLLTEKEGQERNLKGYEDFTEAKHAFDFEYNRKIDSGYVGSKQATYKEDVYTKTAKLTKTLPGGGQTVFRMRLENIDFYGSRKNDHTIEVSE